MLAPRLLANLLLLALAAGMAGCCCFPPLSCRYGDPGCPGPIMTADCGFTSCGAGGRLPAGHGLAARQCQDGNCQEGQGHRLYAHHGRHHKEPVPTRQHYDYVSPAPKFHPVPTRPVFEPQPDSLPPHPLAGPEPRRRLIHESHLLHHHEPHTGAHFAQPIMAEPFEGEPHPARSPQPLAE